MATARMPSVFPPCLLATGATMATSTSDGYNADFWSSTEFNSDCAYGMYLRSFSDGAYLYDGYKSNGFSIRCLRD